MSAGSDTIHASAIAIDGRGVVIRGASGSGKSSLLLSLMMGTPAAVLVADDRVILSVDQGRVFAAVPEALAGQLEVRGLGIVRRPHVSPVVIDLVVDLLPLAECPRMPAPEERETALAGILVPRVFVSIGAADAPFRVRAALAAFADKSLI
jgi:serine kinase of HPr protein (carbohydrate metabolism regulator)